MDYRFASRMAATPRSFIREILKVTEDPGIISFGGGLPSPSLFPVEDIIEASREVLSSDGPSVLQYATTEGYFPLRKFIAERYRKRTGFLVKPENVLITNGSQQCLDLIGKVFLDRGDPVLIERPGYLGAIQAFSLYEPVFHGVTLHGDGVHPQEVSPLLRSTRPKIFYGVPNFQNPSGITYSGKTRADLAKLLSGEDCVFVEDDAYGELRFRGDDLPLVSSRIPEQAVVTGSFSKIIAPGMRMGWIVAPDEVYSQLITAKQGSDLHSNYFTQRIIHQYLARYDIDRHIRRIRAAYKTRCDTMIRMIGEEFPSGVSVTRPDGGMFVWATLPGSLSALDLFEIAIREKVAFVPGNPFYTDGGGTGSMRLNYTNSSEEQIIEGITRLGSAIRTMPGM